MIPSILFLVGMSHEIIGARLLGMIGLVKFYQEFYGTCIYFLSFVFNQRYKGKKFSEVALFVGLSNGLWFVFPLIGMWASFRMIVDDNYAVFE